MDWSDFDGLLDAALEEDSAARDVTSEPLVATDRQVQADIRAKAEGVVCGLPLARRLAERFDACIRFQALTDDGERVAPGVAIAHLAGPARSILAVERTMLNFLQRLSGIATLTACFVAKVQGTDARIYDTRKTMPGYRALAKYAVRCGGGCNHRMSLGDAVLIKDNHLALMTGGAGAPAEAVRLTRAANPDLLIEVEVDTLEQLAEALDARPDVVLLDNMTPEQVQRAAEMVRERWGEGKRPLLEASGMVTLETVGAYATAGADRIAVGALTHSAPALDLSMDFAV